MGCRATGRGCKVRLAFLEEAAVRIRRFVVGTILGLIVAAVPAAAFGQAYPGGTTENNTPSAQVQGVSVEKTTPAAPVVAGKSQGLAFTGSDIAGTTAIGLILVGLGVVLVRRSRRPQLA